jgi:hypothetical protein
VFRISLKATEPFRLSQLDILVPKPLRSVRGQEVDADRTELRSFEVILTKEIEFDGPPELQAFRGRKGDFRGLERTFTATADLDENEAVPVFHDEVDFADSKADVSGD